MRAGKIVLVVIMVLGLATPALAQKLLIAGIGKIHTGMQLKQALKTLGYPDSFIVKRGPSATTDHIEMGYAAFGIIIRAMSKGKIIEAIEVQPTFKGKGSFDTGLKLGSPFTEIVAKYGTPETLSSQIVRYPAQGIYFLMSDSKLLSAKLFVKDSKLLEHKMVRP